MAEKLDVKPCYAIYSAGLAIQRTYKPLLDKLGITYLQFLVLTVLWERDRLTISDIADRLSLETSTLTPVLKRMEAAGFIGRRRNPNDERQVLIELTEQGHAFDNEQTECLGREVFGKLSMSVERIFHLTDEVKALREALNSKLAEGGAS
jgi:DNA-binding MarR family transcriptional regulator